MRPNYANLFDGEKLDIENESSVGRDGAEKHSCSKAQSVGWETKQNPSKECVPNTLTAIAELRGDDQLATTTNLHASNTFVPATNDFTSTEIEFERLISVYV